MSQTPEKMTWRYQLAAVARDVLTISAVMSLVSSLAWVAMRPYVAPFLELPKQVADINARLSPITDPHLVTFEGNGLILDTAKTVQRGGSLRILYNLRRFADCATDIETSFINVDTGTLVTTATRRATQAPVTEDYTYFILQLDIPETLQPGRYSYFPRIVPVNCGIYRPYRGAMSQIFEVTA